MLIIKVNKGKIEPALKAFKNKVRKTKQLQKLREDKYFTKKSKKRRLTKQKAIYKEHLKRSME